MRRFTLLINISSLVIAWYFASQQWATATISETGQVLAISGLDAYPQLSFLMLTGLLLLWLSRYLNSLFSKFLASAVSVLLLATSSPIWFESASGSASILSPQIAKATGVSDWLGQAELIEKVVYNHIAADFFIIALIIWFGSLVWFVWSASATEKAKKLVTRIDNLPNW
ncbi:MAG: hypothetical protein RL166_707 [Actinomycetota bacterium]